MENYQGDLADIVRATGGGATTESLASGGQQLLSSVQTNWQQFMSTPLEQVDDEFGDPFSNARDPLLHDLDMVATGSCFFDSSINVISSSNLDENPGRFHGDGDGDGAGAGEGGGNNILISPKFGDEEIIRRAGAGAAAGGGGDNIFSRMLQISPSAKLSSSVSSPCDSPAAAASIASPRGGLKVNSSKGSFVENGGVQISSPPSAGIKRRKSQAKKVVCIPAPTPANSRPAGGEVVPSDLWAWRKYGQKPIKGSPYPRGYYRCSSSKGCSARKQVERSRTDPNMLVITYTSEHNHPWPTQRNALAGSTRSQPSNKAGTTSKATTTTATGQKTAVAANLKQEQQKESLISADNNNNNNISSSIVADGSGSSTVVGTTTVSVKEEMEDVDHHKQMEMNDAADEFSDGFQQSYKPSMLPDSNRSEDFFADLGELETDPLNLLLFTTQGYSGEGGRENNKAAQVDPFTFYDWPSTDNNVNSHGNNNYYSSIQEDSNKGS